MDDKPWADLDQYAEEMLKAEADRLGLDLRDLGILSRRRINRIKRYEVPLSSVPLRGVDDDEE